jgi:hypothetical protein
MVIITNTVIGGVSMLCIQILAQKPVIHYEFLCSFPQLLQANASTGAKI